MLLPYLEITAPDGTEQVIPLEKLRYTLGRLPRVNDICIADDMVTRLEHCVLERHTDGWCVSDAGSSNGTVLMREGFQNQRLSLSIQQEPEKRAALKPGDLIVLAESDWKIVFQDQDPTPKRIGMGLDPLPRVQFVYNLSRQTLLCKGNSPQPEEITLRPKARELVAYLAQRNWDNDRSPIVCPYDELIEALWPGKPVINNDVQGLAREIRKALNEYGGTGAQLLETRKGLGYILHITVER